LDEYKELQMAVKSISISGMGGQKQLSISSVAATTVPTDIPVTADYSIWTDTDCYIQIGSPKDAAVTTSTGWILYAGGMPPPITITGGSVISVITSAATGTFSYHKIGVNR
jgi:hypothetical protein